MGRVFLCIIILAIICMTTGCQDKESVEPLYPGEAIDTEDTGEQTDTTNQEEEEEMEFDFMTKKEFIDYIETHDTGVTVEDFEGIDIDDFIHKRFLTNDNIYRFNLVSALEAYLRNLEAENRAVYFAQEIVSVESTDAEYEMFIKKFIAATGLKIEAIDTFDGLDPFYAYYEDEDGKEKWQYIYIGQTKNFSQIDVDYKEGDGYGYPVIIIRNGDMGSENRFCYNKNKKYFLISYLNDDVFDLEEIFTAME